LNFRRILPALCLCLYLCLSSGAFAQDFTINEFTSSIAVNKDSSLTVRETLSVEFHRPRHGIFRDIPYRYQDSFGSSIRTPIAIISVTDGSDGRVAFTVNRTGNVIRVRIGDAERYVSGLQRYEITYRVQNAILFFDDHDELYWNVTGNDWNAPIKKARSLISLEGQKTKQHWASCYTGRRGSRESACSYIPGDNVIEFISEKDFMPGEGFTIAYGWDKGIVSPPSSLRKFIWIMNPDQNWVFILPLLSLIVMITLWTRIGRDPRVRESVTVMYGPPQFDNKPLTPAEVGSMVDENLDPRDITATIVRLAVSGYIRIEETKKEGLIFDSMDYYLKKLKEPDALLSLFERQLMQDIFGSLPGRMVSEMKNSFYRNIPSLKSLLYEELVQKKYFATSPDNVRKTYLVTGGVLTAGTIVLLSTLLGDRLGDVRPFIAGLLAGLPVLGFAKYMPAKTRAGSAVYLHILGFQEFLNRAEKDQLARMKDQNLFSTFFSYALALDVADNWAKAFEGIYQEQPDWYVSSGGMRTFNPVGFNRSFHAAVSDMSTAVYSAPRGSGSGGSGSSGGGFGGGGGGSW